MMPSRMASKTSMGVPAGLALVFSMSGGIALRSRALATREVPWRPM